MQCFHIFLRPFGNYSIFFLQLLLSCQSSSINPFSPISPLIPSAQVRLGLPRFLLPGGRHFITPFGNLPSSILWTCPHHCSCFVLISSTRYLVTFIFCLMVVFLILSFLEILAERRQKSISVEFNFATVCTFKYHVYCCICNCTFNYSMINMSLCDYLAEFVSEWDMWWSQEGHRWQYHMAQKWCDLLAG